MRERGSSRGGTGDERAAMEEAGRERERMREDERGRRAREESLFEVKGNKGK